MSLRMRLSAAVLRPVARAAMARAEDPELLRKTLLWLTRFVLRGPRDVPCEAVQTPVGEALWLGKRQPKTPIIFYVHGGGYIAGSPQTHRKMAARLAQLTGLAVYLPPYRLAPENPLPAARDDIREQFNALCAQGAEPQDIIVGGDSAGGGLALGLLTHLCQKGRQPLAFFAFSPFTDVSFSGPSVVENAKKDTYFPGDRVQELAKRILGDMEAADPSISPLFADFPRCPPVLLQVSQSEILRDDSLRLAQKLRDQSTDVTVQTWQNAPHVWQLADGWWPEARDALEKTAGFIRAQVK